LLLAALIAQTQAWGQQAPTASGSGKPPVEQQPQIRKKAPTSTAPRQTAPGPESTQPHPRKPKQPVRLPEPGKSDGKPASAASLQGDSNLEASTNNVGPDEQVTAPFAPAPFVPASAPTGVSPPEKPVVLPEKPAAREENLIIPPEKPAAAQENPVMPPENEAARQENPAPPPEAPAVPQGQPATPEPNDAPTSENPAPPKAATQEISAIAAPPTPAPIPAVTPMPPAEDRPETITLDVAVFDQIRLEIKSRLPYFQACADAARRRGSADVRRVQAIWCIAADGVIKELKLEGVPDAQLATCITRMGSRPFEIKPGAELIIPTPIVFVR
jgi:hypothetical protein